MLHLPAENGSSPPTWGIRTDGVRDSRDPRFIPTYVGHTWIRVSRMPPGAVHPHLRGAYGLAECVRHIRNGSSPPTWGIRCHQATIRLSHRFIPTYVGHTGTKQESGDKSRFIPTYVGHTDSEAKAAWNGAVHPHLRGAYAHLVGQLTERIGSSPPTWGIHGRDVSHHRLQRFIPTYVGHTPPSGFFHPPRPVHPHLRGAYMAWVSSIRYFNGSSPPTWGILLQGRLVAQPERFIPTYVGHTPLMSTGKIFSAVHPHLRGAYRPRPFVLVVRVGSSPPTWGIRTPPRPILRAGRFIPTYVGHTFML